MEEILFWKRCKKFWKGLKTWKSRECQWVEGEGEELACICLALCADVLTWVHVVLTLLPPPCNTFFTQLQGHQFCVFSDLAVHPFSVSLSVSSSFLRPLTFGMPGDAVPCCLHLCLGALFQNQGFTSMWWQLSLLYFQSTVLPGAVCPTAYCTSPLGWHIINLRLACPNSGLVCPRLSLCWCQLHPSSCSDKTLGVVDYFSLTHTLSTNPVAASAFIENPSILTLSTSTAKPCPVSHLPCIIISASFSSVHSLSRVRLFATPWTAVHQDSLSFTNSQSLLKLMSIESVMSPNHRILCHPRLLLPSAFPSIRVFSKESVLCITWPSIGASASLLVPCF